MSDPRPEKVSFYRPVHQGVLIIFATVAVIGALAAIYSVRLILIGTLLGIGIGSLLAPLAERLHARYRIPRTITALLCLVIGYGAVGVMGYFLITMVSSEIVPVLTQLPHFLKGFEEHFARISRTHPWMGLPSGNLDVQKYVSGAVDAVFAGVRLGASAIAGAVFIFFVALYLAIRPGDYLEGLISALPDHQRAGTRRVLHNCAHSLRHWFWAQLTAMSIVGALAAIALKIVGSPYWLFFGALAFVLELVPYFGPLTAITAVCVVTAAGDPGATLRTAIAFLVILVLEGNVIVPLVMRGGAKLPPIHLLVLIAVMGEWFGFFGFLMAAPTLAVLRTAYIRAYLPMMDRRRVHPSEIVQTLPRPKRSPTQF